MFRKKEKKPKIKKRGTIRGIFSRVGLKIKNKTDEIRVGIGITFLLGALLTLMKIVIRRS